MPRCRPISCSAIQAFLTAKGKITGGWEEAAHGGGIDKANCYLVGWHKVEASQKLAAEGYRVVVAPAQAYYLDMALSEDWHECGAGWAGWSSLEKTYKFDPSAGWSDAEREKLMGVQACIWCEPMTDRAVFDRLVFPRLSAIAETGWTPPGSTRLDPVQGARGADAQPLRLHGADRWVICSSASTICRIFEAEEKVKAAGITVRRAIPPERDVVLDWVMAEHFYEALASARSRSLCRRCPAPRFIAVKGQELLGFACYDTSPKASSARPASASVRAGRGSAKRF